MNRRGLTRVEVLVLLACIGVLAAIFGPNLSKARKQGSGTACKSNLKNIGTALEMYSVDWKHDYPPTLAHLTPNYLKTIPTCPPVGKVTYQYVGTQAGKHSKYTLVCAGPNHEAIGIMANYPQYTSRTGLIERP